MSLNEVLVPRNLTIPTGPSSPPVCLQAGDKVVVIKTAKGEKQRTSDGKGNMFDHSRNLSKDGREDYKDQTAPGRAGAPGGQAGR